MLAGVEEEAAAGLMSRLLLAAQRGELRARERRILSESRSIRLAQEGQRGPDADVRVRETDGREGDERSRSKGAVAGESRDLGRTLACSHEGSEGCRDQKGPVGV